MAASVTLAAATTTTTRRLLAFHSCMLDSCVHHGRNVDGSIQRRSVTSFKRIRQRHYDSNVRSGIAFSSLEQGPSLYASKIVPTIERKHTRKGCSSSSRAYHPSFATHSNTNFIDPRSQWIIHPDLVHHTRSSYSIVPDDEKKNRDDKNELIFQKDTKFSICCLGTGTGRPSIERSNTATALKLGGSIFLFDAGEGVQRQLALSKLKQTQIQKIFSTFTHCYIHGCR